MTETRQACERCHNPIDLEDLFCDYCGHEIEDGGARASEEGVVLRARSGAAFTIHCRQCGATVGYDEKVQAPRCPFCGSTSVAEQPPRQGAVVPEEVVPFSVDGGQARKALRVWLGKGFFRPGDLAERARLSEMRPVYLPYWRFSCDARVHWTADTNDTPAGASASWCPVGGRFDRRFESLLVAGTPSISAAELGAISPFDFSLATPHSEEAVKGGAVEEMGISRKRARTALYSLVESVAADHARSLARGTKHRNVHATALVENTSSSPVLLPVWIAAYRYREKPYRVVLNGQTGKLTGHAPISWLKVLATIAAVGAAALGLLAILASV